MKRRALSILLACVFLLSVFMFCTTAFAAETNSADGVTAVLETDKDAYVAGETINATLDVENTSIYVDNIRTELIIPEGVTLEEGELKNAVELAAGENVQYTYVLSVPVAEVPTTQAPTTVPGTDDGSPETRDISMLIFGSMAVLSLASLVALTFGAKLMKQRWFVLVLCGALLMGALAPMSASAAVTEKSFEIVKAITIDGAAAEVKAIVTYDLDDNELMETAEVVFKEDGVYLWNVQGEMGYYTPSGVTYNGVASTEKSRSEVYAPYYESLVGTANKAGSWKVDIFNEEAEQTVLIGKTDDAASLKALDHIGKDEWIVTVIDGKIVATGWYDNASKAAANALYELASAEAEDITLTLPIIGKMDYAHGNMPEMTAGTFLNGMDSDCGAVVLRYGDITEADYHAYAQKLTAAGYELYQDNSIVNLGDVDNLYATYVNGEDVVVVMYLPYVIGDADDASLTTAQIGAQDRAFRADGDEIRIILDTADHLFTNEDNNDYEDLGISVKMHNVNLYNNYGDGNDIGQCTIFTLADGSFLVWDGGYTLDAMQLYNTLVEMNERPDGKIVVAGWFFTHDHGDHTGAIATLANTEYAQNITIEQIVINHVANSYEWRGLNDPYGYGYGWAGNYDKITDIAAKFNDGANTQIVIPHMGQVMNIRNANVEILYAGDEDLFPVILNNDNAASLVTMVTFDNEDVSERILLLGDHASDATYNVIFPLFSDGAMHCDVVQTAHHGLGGGTSKLYPICGGPEIAIWCTTWSSARGERNGLAPLFWRSQNEALQKITWPRDENNKQIITLTEDGWADTSTMVENPTGSVELNIMSDEYVHTLVFPFNVQEDEVIRTKIGTYKDGRYDSLEMNVAYLPAFRFQGTFKDEAKRETIIAELESYDADVLILTQIDQLATRYNNMDVVGIVQEELGYPYFYYIPIWDCDKEPVDSEGSMGHVVFSRYPIIESESENIVLLEGGVDGSTNPEGRGVAHVVLNVEGMTVDVYAGHFATDSIKDANGAVTSTVNSWNVFTEAFKSEEYAPVGDYWMIVGNTNKYAKSAEALASALGVSAPVDVEFNDGDYEVYVSNGAVVAASDKNPGWKTITGSQYMSENAYSFTLNLPRYIIQKGEVDTDPNTLVVATLGVARMGGWNDGYVDHLAALIAENVPDVLCLQSVSQNCVKYYNIDMAGKLQTLLGYQYAYYVPAWYVDAGSDQNTNGDGTHGNLILSRYPMEMIESITVQEGTVGTGEAKPEGRSVGHVVVDVEGTKVDVYFTEFEGSKVSDNLAAFAEGYAPKTDKVIIAGILRTNEVSQFETALSEELEIAVESDDYENVLVTSNMALANSKREDGTGNMDGFVVTTVYLDGNGVAEYSLTVNNGTGSGKYQEGAEVTVTANGVGRTKVFTGWVVETGNVTIEDPMQEEITITMPAEEVVITATYADKEAEREPTGETADLNVAVVPVFRFAKSYEANADSINQALLDLKADVLVLIHVDQNSTQYNNCNVPAALEAALKDVYPYSYYTPVWTVGGGYNGHMVFSKYEILETETVWQVADGTSTEARATTRAMLDVDGTTVDLFYMCMGAQSEWDGENGLAAMIKASEADVWIVAGNMRYANPEKSGIETKLGETISAAFEAWNEGGNTHMYNIISSNNCTFSDVKREACNDRFGANADPLYQATITMPLYQDKVTEVALNVAMVPVFRFAKSYEANAASINQALLDLKADVLVLIHVDQNSTQYNNCNVPAALEAALKDVYPYSYYTPVWTVGGGYNGHMIFSKYEILETETVWQVADGTSTEARATTRAMLDVDGTTVDLFYMCMGGSVEWDGENGLAAMIKASKADAWIATGDMKYANPEKSGIETKLGSPISAAFEHYAVEGGGYHMFNIISSDNGTFSDVKREACNDRFGANADPLYQATITFSIV